MSEAEWATLRLKIEMLGLSHEEVMELLKIGTLVQAQAGIETRQSQMPIDVSCIGGCF